MDSIFSNHLIPRELNLSELLREPAIDCLVACKDFNRYCTNNVSVIITLFSGISIVPALIVH